MTGRRGRFGEAMSQLFRSIFKGKKVFVTGHTGFKGSWLCEWLLLLGAEVTGFSLPAPTRPALFEQLALANRLHHLTGDVRDPQMLEKAIETAQPDFVFHLAAQAIVRESYLHPFDTFEVNTMGTARLLDALRGIKKPCAAVFITTDKCYENREWIHGYREEDPLGGHDPYSASKAGAEMVIHSYRRSFFGSHPVKIASARAGNVIGGGDWAADRIVPDCIRALRKGEAIPVRNKLATRPWQHVLEPLSGYLWLAASLAHPELASSAPLLLSSAFNFGPGHDANRTVADLVVEVLKHWPGRWEDRSDPNALHEAKLLQLSTDKAHALLGWSSVWKFSTTIEKTIAWYQTVGMQHDAAKAANLTASQINNYTIDAAAGGVRWAANRDL
jgi:CDP-glucose 4,6-dehydratase